MANLLNNWKASKKTIEGKLLKPSFWVLIGFGIQKLLQLGSNLLLTRLLFPEAFGLMVIVNTCVTGVQMFSDIGIKPSVIRSKNISDPHFLNTAWTLQVARGVALYLLLLLLSYPISILYENDQLMPLLWVCGLTAITSGLASIQVVIAQRNMQLKKVILTKIYGQIVCVLVMASLAWLLKSVWALAIGVLCGAIFELILGYTFFERWKHRFTLNPSHTKTIFNFGKWIFWSTVFTYFCSQGIRMIEGIFVTPTTLAMIAIAGTLAWMMGELIERFLGSIIFPTLSKVQRETPEKFTAILFKTRLLCIAATAPVFGILSIVSHQLIEFLYDQRYHDAGPILAVLAIVAAFRTLPAIHQNALIAVGNSRASFISNGVIATLNILTLYLGYTLFGLFGLLVAPAIAYLGGHIATLIIVRKLGWIDLRGEFLFFSIIIFFMALLVKFHDTWPPLTPN